MIFKTKLQKEYNHIINGIKIQLHQQNFTQYQKQVANTKLPKNDTNIIKKTWKQDKQQARELICWCYDIIALQAIIGEDSIDYKLYNNNENGILNSSRANALKVKTLSNTSLTSHSVYEINFNDIIEKIVEYNYKLKYLSENAAYELLAINQTQALDQLQYQHTDQAFNATQQELVYQNQINELYNKTITEQTDLQINDKFEARLNQLDAITNLTTTEFEIVQKFDTNQKQDLLKLSDGALIAGIKAVCIKYQRDLNNNDYATEKSQLEQFINAKLDTKATVFHDYARLIEKLKKNAVPENSDTDDNDDIYFTYRNEE